MANLEWCHRSQCVEFGWWMQCWSFRSSSVRRAWVARVRWARHRLSESPSSRPRRRYPFGPWRVQPQPHHYSRRLRTRPLLGHTSVRWFWGVFWQICAFVFSSQLHSQTAYFLLGQCPSQNHFPISRQQYTIVQKGRYKMTFAISAKIEKMIAGKVNWCVCDR